MHLPRRARAAVLGALLSTVAVAGMTGTALAVADDRCDRPGQRSSCAADPAALALVSTTPRTAPSPPSGPGPAVPTPPTRCPDPRGPDPRGADPRAAACPPVPVQLPVGAAPSR